MAKRTGKFYYKNEKETMLRLGLEPTPGSGSGFVAKEDGENDVILAQLKSTDSESLKVNLLDVKKLEYHAGVAHKIPVFMVQFLQSDDVFMLVRPEDIAIVSEYINTGVYVPKEAVGAWEETKVKSKKVISSGGSSRVKFHEDMQKEYESNGKKSRGKVFR